MYVYVERLMAVSPKLFPEKRIKISYNFSQCFYADIFHSSCYLCLHFFDLLGSIASNLRMRLRKTHSVLFRSSETRI